MDDRVAAVEAAGYAAWPARERLDLDSWQLRFADGFSRRGNSVLALGEIEDDFDDRIALCARWFAERGLDLVFRMTPLSAPSLDSALDARGFGREGDTDVMVCDLATAGPSVQLPEAPSDHWWRAMSGLWGIDAAREPAWRGIIDRIDRPAAYPMLTADGSIRAAGLGVVEGEWLGLFEIAVAEDARRQGWGAELTGSLLEWGRAQGARHAFLQVVAENSAAIALYERLGFSRLYRYWYRRSPG